MNTSKQSQINARNGSQNSSNRGIDTWFNEQAEKFEKSRFGWMAGYSAQTDPFRSLQTDPSF